MGLAASQVHFLALTARKADCERDITTESMNKMAITREMTDLAQEYSSKLKSKQISYYHNGEYNLIDTTFLFGSSVDATPIMKDSSAIKGNKSMILTDYKGAVVLTNNYAKAIVSVLGSGSMDAYGRGNTFSKDNLAAIIAAIEPCAYTTEEVQTVLDGGIAQATYQSTPEQMATGEERGETKTVDISEYHTANIQKIIDFYSPIILAASTNGWTTEYNNQMDSSETYISDALVSGAFQLVTVDERGEYDEGGTLTFFLNRGDVDANITSETREEITAWFNAEKARISEKETFSDLRIDELSTELEAIKAELESLQTFIDDAISSVFDWGG